MHLWAAFPSAETARLPQKGLRSQRRRHSGLGFSHSTHPSTVSPSAHFDSFVQSSGSVATPFTPSLQFRDRLASFHNAWSLIATDTWVLSTIRLGCAIQFLSTPPSPFLFRHPSQKILLLKQVCSLLALGAEEEVPPEHWGQVFYSGTFWFPYLKEW